VLELLKIAGVAAAGLVLAMSVFQERLIFLRQPPGPAPQPPSNASLERVDLRAADGTALAGWLVRHAGARAPLLIYFGGNAEEVSWVVGASQRFAGWSLLAVNYRGYGESGGDPGEKTLFADALAIYDYAASRDDVESRSIAVMGRSLGSAVAVHLAAQRAVAGVLLVAPFDSLEAVAARVYPFLPVRWLLRHRFDSIALAPAISAPALFIVAERDSVIPVIHARRLHDGWAGARHWVEIRGADHNDLDARPEFWDATESFLRTLAASAEGTPSR
jgi:pimeloyl-ACP methyl ester carboxylesterase